MFPSSKGGTHRFHVNLRGCRPFQSLVRLQQDLLISGDHCQQGPLKTFALEFWCVCVCRKPSSMFQEQVMISYYWFSKPQNFEASRRQSSLSLVRSWLQSDTEMFATPAIPFSLSCWIKLVLSKCNGIDFCDCLVMFDGMWFFLQVAMWFLINHFYKT